MEYGVINNGGHVLIYGIDSLIGWESGNYDIYNSEYDYAGIFSKILSHPGSFCYFAHMQAADYNNLLNSPYNPLWDSAIVGLGIRNGPAFSTDTSYSNPSTSNYLARYQDLLRKGYHVSVGMDHDNHYITFGRDSKERTVVLAQSLTRSDLMDAFRHRRFYASDDWNAKVNYTINSQVMGSITSSASNPMISITVNDPDPEATSSIQIWYGIPGSGVTATMLTSVTNNSSLNYTHVVPQGAKYYYYAEITQADGDKIWTAPIWFTKSAGPLPVEMLSFTAEKNENSIALKWSTASEINNDYFSLKRSNSDFDFKEIVRFPGSGNSTEVNKYEAEDESPYEGINYYRLDQFDYDGTEYSSGIIPVEFSSSKKSLFVFPNPSSNGEIEFTFHSGDSESFIVELFNSEGNGVYASSYYIANGTDHYKIPAGNYPDGIYFLRIYFRESGASMTSAMEIRR
jgi:hypothetical protein